MERKRVGQGWEHTVYSSGKDGWVLKAPRFPVVIANAVFGFGADRIRDELREDQELVSDSNILKIPETRIFYAQRKVVGRQLESYIIAQRYVEEDNSIQGIEDKLRAEGQNLMADRYGMGRVNFIANNGNVFMIDPTSLFGRIAEKLGLPPNLLTSFSAKIAKILGK